MKIEKLNLGHPMTKEQQKQIKGGSGVCSTSQQFRCTCEAAPSGPGTYCLYGDGVHDTNYICSYYCYVASTHTYCGDPVCSSE